MPRKSKDTVVEELRCWRCDKKLAEAAGPGTKIRCLRCGARSQVPENDEES